MAESLQRENVHSARVFVQKVEKLAQELELLENGKTYGTQRLDRPDRLLPSMLIDIPCELCDPVTHEVLVDPVVGADGKSYERAHLELWLTSHDTSPVTGEQLSHTSFVPNIQLRLLCERLFSPRPPDSSGPDASNEEDSAASGRRYMYGALNDSPLQIDAVQTVPRQRLQSGKKRHEHKQVRFAEEPSCPSSTKPRCTERQHRAQGQLRENTLSNWVQGWEAHYFGVAQATHRRKGLQRSKLRVPISSE